ncbi:DUF5999 family protein [Streptomyces griseomycini]|uniref:DUF5999 family protein n=1 Tax=Streptomyces griseomycini TaxID=66895 RepID=UPI0019A6F542|nr:DUF5999 family protein [Streptomyces griseomycini]GGR28017.1 hypothetical protein GCM10015536_36930 [Streptomyces griseomycini]
MIQVTPSGSNEVSTACAPPNTHASEVQRRSLLCDGSIVFDDTGELLPDGRVIAPHRAPADRLVVAA